MGAVSVPTDSPVLTLETLKAAFKKFRKNNDDEILYQHQHRRHNPNNFGFPENDESNIFLLAPVTFWVPPDTCKFEFPNSPRRMPTCESRMDLIVEIADATTIPAEVAFGYQLTGQRKAYHERSIADLVCMRMGASKKTWANWWDDFNGSVVIDSFANRAAPFKPWVPTGTQTIFMKPIESTIPFTTHEIMRRTIVENPYMKSGLFAILPTGF